MTNTAGAFPPATGSRGPARLEKISAEALLRQCSVKPNAAASASWPAAGSATREGGPPRRADHRGAGVRKPFTLRGLA